MVPFNNGKTIPVKKRRCDKCKVEKLCMTCKNQVKENKEIEANLYLLERQAPNHYGYLLPCFKV